MSRPNPENILRSGPINPSVNAQFGAEGDLWCDTSTSKLYVKTDGGSSVNWVEVVSKDSSGNFSASTITATLSGNQLMPCATVAAAGNAQGNAAAVAVGFTLVSAADGTKGVILPAAAAGKICIIKNIDAADAILKIYPSTDDAINAIAANGALSIAAKTAVFLIAYDATTWYSLPLLAS